MDIYFLICVLIQYYFTKFAAQVISPFGMGTLSAGSRLPFSYPHPCGGFALSYLLAPQNGPGSSSVFPAPDLESAITLRSPGQGKEILVCILSHFLYLISIF